MIDSHCHLTDEAYAADVDEVIVRAGSAGVHGIVSIASNADDAERAHDLAGRHGTVWCTAGIHPHEASTAEADFGRIRDQLRRPRVVAIGETGLDYHYNHSPPDVQRRSFDRHLDLAAETGRPVVVHCREADDDMIAAIRGGRGIGGVLHCFSGGDALLDCALDAGWHIAFGGMITFRRWTASDQLRRVPDDRLMLETDGPYLAPVPYRGKRNEPAFMVHTCEVAAGLRGVTMEAMGAFSEQVARRFYGLG